VEGHYKPDALIGITNGGAIFADLLGRQVGYRCPILSLWANRAMTDYFHNAINDAICQGITNHLAHTEPKTTNPKLLLVDDIVASGHTYRHAINYLRDRMPESDISFMPLFFRNENNFREVENMFVWRQTKFGFSYDEIAEMHRVNWHRFPYEKDIRAN
jgi:hypoxanthine phosphoribosyltransferase